VTIVTSSIPDLLRQWPDLSNPGLSDSGLSDSGLSNPGLSDSGLSNSDTRNTIIAIGNFDGVHLGHQRVLNHACEVAKQQPQQTKTVVITFDPPAKVLFQGQKYLTDRTEKVELLKRFGFTAVVVIPFTHAYAQTDKQLFVNELQSLHPSHIIVGEDFRFGNKRQGGLDDLSHVTEYLEVVGIYSVDNEAVKSSYIRSLLEAAQVTEAKRFLGRSYSARGLVIEGDRRGRTIGYPTANLRIPPEKALPQGVFAVYAELPQGRTMGMANVGKRPSFDSEPPALEVNLFDIDTDLYGCEITVYFEAYLRGQRAFAGLEDLKNQLATDAKAARDILTKS
jgi:riboflavin kinase / FMN adenylyltransferase